MNSNDSSPLKVGRRRLNTLKLKDKLKIIREIEKNRKKKDIATEFGISASTLTSIYKKKDFILSNTIGYNNLNRKRFRKCTHPKLDEAVLQFVEQARSLNLPISGNIIKEKAKQYATKMSLSGFNASHGWLTKFVKRHDISYKKLSGESADVSEIDSIHWKENELSNFLQLYSPEDIFNIDETGLFFKCLPEKTFAFKHERCFGGKHSKERITILIGTNMTGNEKLKLLVIGKSKRPRCFKSVKSLPVDYKSNKKAWMTGDIFQEWLQEFDEKMRKDNRKILMFLDNCTAHPKSCVEKMSNIQMVYFPANTTSKLQPLDLGIIKNIKHYYRECLVFKQLEEMEKGQSASKVTLLDAIRSISKIWQNNIKPVTIQNCFAKAGFIAISKIEKNINLFESVELNINDVPKSEESCKSGAWELLKTKLDLNISFSDYVGIDDDICITGIQTDEEILDSVINENFEEKEIEQECTQNESYCIPSYSETKNALNILYKKMIASDNTTEEIFKSFYRFEAFVESNK